jgi:hypothetical protein
MSSFGDVRLGQGGLKTQVWGFRRKGRAIVKWRTHFLSQILKKKVSICSLAPFYVYPLQVQEEPLSLMF